MLDLLRFDAGPTNYKKDGANRRNEIFDGLLDYDIARIEEPLKSGGSSNWKGRSRAAARQTGRAAQERQLVKLEGPLKSGSSSNWKGRSRAALREISIGKRWSEGLGRLLQYPLKTQRFSQHL